VGKVHVFAIDMVFSARTLLALLSDRFHRVLEPPRPITPNLNSKL
jgi:hypothetical protein